MSNIKIRIKMGSNEIEVEAPIEVMDNAIEFIPKVMAKMDDKKMDINSNIPNITIEKSDSLSDVILKLFKDDWGRNARRLSDVKNVLESYGLMYPKQSIAVTLMRLTQNGKLRRFKGDNNEYLYTASIQLLNNGEIDG
ncbi:MAG: hypothetical protein KatS3mg003_2132 [Candidatus Nitrosocaldaceae archaeon]|nr:MAG: hypothetical protein KatS3mg003_2132 [Candidatus Nitrosocaldaceae archaeon]